MPNIFKPKRSTTASSVPTTGNLSDGELAVNLTDRKVFVRNGASIVTVADALVDGDKGDITVSSSGASWTIDSGVVTNAKLANVSTATIKGRTTAGTGSPEDLTGTQATALLDTFTTSLKGLAPASGGGTSNFLRADGTWAAPTISSITGTVTGTNSTDLVYGNMADNDQFRIRIGGTASDSGFVEIATADNGTEPIYVRQYSGVFTTLTRTATLLDGSGNTSFPGSITGNTIVKSGGTSSQFLKADGSVDSNTYLTSASTLTAGNLSGTIPSAVLGNSSHFIGTTSIALNRASASQSLTGVSIDGSSGSCTGNANTATTLATTRTIWGQNFNGSANVTGALSGATDITATGTIKGNQVIGGTGSAIGSAGLIVNGTTGDNDSQLIIKKPSQSSFGVLSWDGQVFLSANIYYENSAWVHSAPTSNTNNNMLVLAPGTGVQWYASNNSTGSWNVAGGTTLWNDSGVWQRSLSNTLTLNTSGTGLSGSTTYNNSGAATFTVTSNATSANTVSTIVARDASGNFSAGTITATLSGNATSATTATSATSAGSVTNSVTFNNGGAGAASGTTFNGSAAQTISHNTIGASPLAGSTSLTTTGTVTTGTWSGSFGAVSGANLTNLTAGNLSGTIPSAVLGNSVHFIGTTSIALNRASASQSLTGVNIDGSSGSCTGNAATATTLQTARTINNVSFNGSANIVVPTIFDSNYYSIMNPGGAQYVTTTATVTGAIAITFPVGMTNSMVRMTIKVYEYTTNESFEIHCGGYAYNVGNTWANNPFAYITGHPDIDRRFSVRFGYTAAGRAIVYIGELASTWSYPQVFVTEVQVGYSGASSTWSSGWAISFVTAAFENVTATISDCQTDYRSSSNTAKSLVYRDASGNFSAGTITATLSGNATSATTATSATSAGSVTNSVTFNNGGAGAASGTTFNGSAAQTISYNTIGASPLAGSASLTTTGTVTSGTWSASFGAVSGANLTNLTAGNLSGTIPSAVLGNSSHFIGTTSIALNRASASQSLTGVNIDGSSGSCTGNAATATTLQTTRTIWGQNFNGSANVTGALSGATTGTFSSTVSATAYTSTVATGTAPLTVTSTTKVANLNADLLDDLDSTAFKRINDQNQVNVTAPASTTGTWTSAGTSDEWGNPKFDTTFNAYTYADAPATIQFNVPAGMKSAWISQLTWSSGGYVDVHGVQSGGQLVFLRRINTRQTVENTDEGVNHDGSTITFAASGLDDYTAIRFTVQSGRFHLTGLSFSTADNEGTEGVGMVHPAQISHQGAGSTLDADLLDGQQGSYYTTAGNLTGTIPSGVLGNSSLFVGTTSIALNRASASQSLTGVNIDGSSGSCTGNANTATTLATTRTIWGQNFNGSANVTGALTGVTDITASGNVSITGTLGSGKITPTYNSGITGATAPNYTQSNIELYTTSNNTPALGFHRSGVSATVLYEYDGQLYVNAWTTRAQTGLLMSVGNYNSYAPTLTGTGASGSWGISITGSSASCTGNAATATSATSAGSVTNSVTFNNGGAGAASGTTFNGSAAQTISYNTIGASPLAGSASLTTTGTVTSGTWSGSFGSVSGANLTNLTAGNLSGTIPSGVLGNSSHFIGTTSIALNRASAAQTLTGVSIDGNAATSTQLTTLDDRTISPSEITTGRLQFGFTSWNNNNTSPYADYLHLRGYTDASGGNDNLVMFRKDAIGMRIWQQSYGSATAYASFKDVCWTDGTNATGTGWAISITGSSASCTGNAATATSATSAGSVTNSLTFNNGGSGAASGTTFNGSAAQTISHNTIGASPLAGSASLTTTGTVTTGTWSASFGAVSGANLTNLTAGNLSGTIPSGVLGNSAHFIGTTSIALNRASAAQALTGITSIDGSAATLTTTRTIWGQNFNGSANVTGALTGVTDITATGNVAVDGAFRAESSNSTERFDIYYNETTDSLDFDYLTA